MQVASLAGFREAQALAFLVVLIISTAMLHSVTLRMVVQHPHHWLAMACGRDPKHTECVRAHVTIHALCATLLVRAAQRAVLALAHVAVLCSMACSQPSMSHSVGAIGARCHWRRRGRSSRARCWRSRRR